MIPGVPEAEIAVDLPSIKACLNSSVPKPTIDSLPKPTVIVLQVTAIPASGIKLTLSVVPSMCG